MPNQSWIKIRRDNGKEDYAPVSRSKFYPEQSAKQLAKKLAGDVGDKSPELQPGVCTVPTGPTLDQLYEPPKDADDRFDAAN